MKLLVVIEDNFNDIELTTTLSCLRRANPDISIDYYNKTLNQAHGQYQIAFIPNVLNNIANINLYDALFVPGGKGAQTLRSNQDSLDLIQKFVSLNKYVFAICDAPNVLKEALILDQKDAFTSFPSDWSKELRKHNYHQESYVFQTSDKIITAKAADASMELGYYMVKTLYGKEEANKVYQGMTGNTDLFFK